jgi:hypothetical protein
MTEFALGELEVFALGELEVSRQHANTLRCENKLQSRVIAELRKQLYETTPDGDQVHPN